MDSTNTQQQTPTVVLADDHNIVRHAIRTILERNGEYRVVGEATTADETVRIVDEHNPDLLILDLGLPGKSGVEAIHELARKGARTKIVVLTMFEDESMIRHSFSAGARGYILKDSSPEEFRQALIAVRNGETCLPKQFDYLSSELPKLHEIASKGNGHHEHDPLSKLSKREREVFYLLVDGIPNRNIAKKLFISPRTVETHRARVIKKLGFSSTADLIRYAIRNNLMSL